VADPINRSCLGFLSYVGLTTEKKTESFRGRFRHQAGQNLVSVSG